MNLKKIRKDLQSLPREDLNVKIETYDKTFASDNIQIRSSDLIFHLNVSLGLDYYDNVNPDLYDFGISDIQIILNKLTDINYLDIHISDEMKIYVEDFFQKKLLFDPILKIVMKP